MSFNPIRESITDRINRQPLPMREITRRTLREGGILPESTAGLTLTSKGPGQPPQWDGFQDTQLTATQVKGLAAGNVTLVDAPVSGFAVFPTAVHLYLDHGGSNDFVQTNASDHLAIRYSASTEIAELGSEAQCTALIEASADAALYVPITAAIVPVAATALDLDNNGAAEYSGNAADDNTLSVRVYYVTFPMAAFS